MIALEIHASMLSIEVVFPVAPVTYYPSYVVCLLLPLFILAAI